MILKKKWILLGRCILHNDIKNNINKFDFINNYKIKVKNDKMSLHKRSINFFRKRCRILSEELKKAKKEGDNKKEEEIKKEYNIWFNLMLKTMGKIYLEEKNELFIL